MLTSLIQYDGYYGGQSNCHHLYWTKTEFNRNPLRWPPLHPPSGWFIYSVCHSAALSLNRCCCRMFSISSRDAWLNLLDLWSTEVWDGGKRDGKTKVEHYCCPPRPSHLTVRQVRTQTSLPPSLPLSPSLLLDHNTGFTDIEVKCLLTLRIRI